MTAPLRLLAALTAAAAAASVTPLSQASVPTARSFPASFVAAVSGRAQGLAVFSAASGRRERWLVRSRHQPEPVAVSPSGRWVYYNQAPAGSCPHNGFTEPVLWQVPARGGRPRRSGLRTNSIAFSPDGRMTAYLVTRTCGRTIWIIVRNRRTGTSRRIVLVHNAATAASIVTSATLSLAPDDRHLAVGLVITPAIETVTVIDARRATSVAAAPPIRPCAGRPDECLDPAFDTRGRLTFLKWLNLVTGTPEWIMRWHNRQAVRLARLSRDQSAFASATIAVDRTGGAILLAGGSHVPKIWRWSGGRFRLIVDSTRQLTVVSPVWSR